MRFRIDESFWSLFPEALVGVVVVRGIDNTRHAAECEHLLVDSAREAAGRLGDADISTHPAVAPWREAYRSFGAKPSKYRSSIEHLLRSAGAGTVRGINPLVDVYNTISLRYMLPCGGEDLAAVRGNIRLTRAEGGERFVPLGSTEESPPQPGEVVYRDDAGVLCRCWNWREAERTELTECTTDAFMCVEWVPAKPAPGRETREAACADLAGLVGRYLGGEASVWVLARARPEVQIGG